MYVVHVLRGKDWIHDSEWRQRDFASQTAAELSRQGGGRTTMMSVEEDSSGYKPLEFWDDGSCIQVLRYRTPMRCEALIYDDRDLESGHKESTLGEHATVLEAVDAIRRYLETNPSMHSHVYRVEVLPLEKVKSPNASGAI